MSPAIKPGIQPDPQEAGLANHWDGPATIGNIREARQVKTPPVKSVDLRFARSNFKASPVEIL